MSNEQKLREALQAISHIDDTTNHSVDASAALDRIGQIARQALALPPAVPESLEALSRKLDTQTPDLEVSEMINGLTQAETDASASVSGLTAAPVGDREAFEREMRCEEEWGHRSLKKRQNGQYENWQVDLMWAVWQARAALGDWHLVEFLNQIPDSEIRRAMNLFLKGRP